MDNLIDIRYFRGLIELPFIKLAGEFGTSSDDTISNEQSELNLAIVEYQEEFLTKLFGSNVLPSEVSAYIVKENILKSVIADYVFCQIIHEYQSQATATGEKTDIATNTNNGQYMERYIAVWNRMVDVCILVRSKLIELGIDSDYPTEDDSDIYEYKFWL